MKTPAFLFLYFLSGTFFCSAQSAWTHYDKDNSPLLSNIVSSIAVDHNNNLWGAYAGAGGSGDGIVKFDGNTWTPYNSTNSGLPNNDVRDIAVDLQGNVWFACYNAGIVKFNGTTWTRYHSANSGIAGNDAIDIEFDSDGNVWVGCYFSGVSTFNGTVWTTHTKSNAPFPDSNCISDLAIDKFNNVWVGMDCQGGMAKLASGSWTGYTVSNSDIPDHTVTTLLADTAGVIWASHINVNVSGYNGSAWTSYEVSGELDRFALDNDGGLWGAGYGLFKFEEDDWTKVGIPEAADTTYALGLAAGTDGKLWLSTYSGIWVASVNAVITGNEPDTKNIIRFFPNPASTSLSLPPTSLAAGSGVVVIRDMTGREVLRYRVTPDNTTLDISDLQPGIYFVKLTQDRGISSAQKLIKVR